MDKKIVIVSCESGDWEGLYIDGVLRTEGHEIPRFELLEALEIECDEFEVTDKAMDKMGCSFPNRLKDVKRR